MSAGTIDLPEDLRAIRDEWADLEFPALLGTVVPLRLAMGEKKYPCCEYLTE